MHDDPTADAIGCTADLQEVGSMASDFVVRFWGVRGSYPVPGPRTLRFGGNTSCVEVQAGPHTIILDAGSGIINLGAELGRRARVNGNHPMVATLLFSHMHHDHTIGFPFFTPAYMGASILHILGPKVFENDLEDILVHSMLPPSFPVALDDLASLRVVKNVGGSDLVLIGPERHEVRVLNKFRETADIGPEMVTVTTYHSDAHPKSGVNIYRISWHGRSVVYATDTEGYVGTDQRLVKFAQGADLLIHDAHYRADDYANPLVPKQGWGHSTPEMACEVAAAAGVKQLVLFHHEPSHDDDILEKIEADAREHFANLCVGYEGLEIAL
jgi:phosphoribosyl 1,2-cyclic phosphodiesterase